MTKRGKRKIGRNESCLCGSGQKYKLCHVPSYTDAYKAKVKYAALNDVQKAMVAYKFPVTFDGEIPEFAFGEAERRFNIGERIEVAVGKFVTLQSGIVAEAEKRAYLTVADEAEQGAIWTAELTDAELAAYRAHPETFFGRVVSVGGNVDNPLDLYEFFLGAYKETPRKTLLEFMNNAPDIEGLNELSDEELRYKYAEGLTWSVMKRAENK
jgi:hypothetical protein